MCKSARIPPFPTCIMLSRLRILTLSPTSVVRRVPTCCVSRHYSASQKHAAATESNHGNGAESNQRTEKKQSNLFRYLLSGIAGALVWNQFSQYYNPDTIDALRVGIEVHRHIKDSEAVHTDVCRLPKNAPSWLVTLSEDQKYIYKDIRKILPTNGHLIQDALHSSFMIPAMYYFIERSPNLDARTKFIHDSLVSEKSIIEHRQAAEKKETNNLPPNCDIDTNKETIDNSTPEVRVGLFLGPKLCGHPSIIHGGLTATLLDEVSGACAFVTSGPGVFTANLNVNYLKPLPANSWVEVRARVTKIENRKTWVEVSVEDGNGAKYASAVSLFVRPKWMPTLK